MTKDLDVHVLDHDLVHHVSVHVLVHRARIHAVVAAEAVVLVAQNVLPTLSSHKKEAPADLKKQVHALSRTSIVFLEFEVPLRIVIFLLGTL